MKSSDIAASLVGVFFILFLGSLIMIWWLMYLERSAALEECVADGNKSYECYERLN